MSREEPEGPEAEAAAGGSLFPAELGGDGPRGEEQDRPCPEPALGPRSSLYFASLDAAVEGLQQRVQDILRRLNGGREEAHTELSGVRDSLLLKVSELTEQLEERLFHGYGFHNGLIQERLQALSEVLERVEGVQAELRRICCTVEAVYQDLCLQPED
nr:synaptonemal complex central element protein 2 [Taeniopygia guttata]XP_041567774.1 synaptonemal complex central element protein 2-like [Taeniopygia guttata]